MATDCFDQTGPSGGLRCGSEYDLIPVDSIALAVEGDSINAQWSVTAKIRVDRSGRGHESLGLTAVQDSWPNPLP